MLVDQYADHVESYVKSDEKRWIFEEYDGLAAVIALDVFAFPLALHDIYDQVQFETATSDPSRQEGA